MSYRRFNLIALLLVCFPLWAVSDIPYVPKFKEIEEGTVRFERQDSEDDGRMRLVEEGSLFTGTMTEYYDNGQKKQQVSFKDGVRHGAFVSWHRNGAQHYQGSNEKGKRHGKYKRWFSDGELEEEGVFNQGRRVTTVAIRRYPSGEKWMETHYRRDVKHGPRTIWGKNGQKRSQYTFKDGKHHGQWTNWAGDGTKANTSTFQNGKLHGQGVEWWPDGTLRRIQTYRNGELIEDEKIPKESDNPSKKVDPIN